MEPGAAEKQGGRGKIFRPLGAGDLYQRERRGEGRDRTQAGKRSLGIFRILQGKTLADPWVRKGQEAVADAD